MNVWIYVAGSDNRRLLERLLDDLHSKVSFKIVEAHGHDAARPLARKQLLTSHEPVVLVVDADTTDDRKAKMQRRDIEEYMAWGGAGTPYKVLQFVPELEVVFFESPTVLRRVVGKAVDEHVKAAGKLAPRRVLSMLAPGTDESALIDKLRPSDMVALRRHPVIAELRSFVESPFPTQAAG